MNLNSFNDIATLTILLPALVGLIRMGRMSFFAQWVFGLALLGVLTEVLAMYAFRPNNYPVYNSYMLLEYVLIAVIYYRMFQVKEARRLMQFLSLIFFVFAFFGLFFVDGFYRINSTTLMLKALILSGYAIYSFQQIAGNLEVNLFKDPVFYFSFGVLSYFVGNLFTFGYGQRYFSDPEKFSFDIWDIHAGFNIIFNLCLALSIWFGREKIATHSS